MTTRREFLALVGAGAFVGLVGCDPDASTPARSTSFPDVLLVDTNNGLAVVRGGELQTIGRGAVSPDGVTIFATRTVGAETELSTVLTLTGRVTRTERIPGDWVPTVVNPFGSAVAMLPANQPTGDSLAPPGRPRTTMLLTGPAMRNGPSRLDLPGNFVPDAFTHDGLGMYVLDWLPATSPDYYKVREITFGANVPTALLTRDKLPIPPDDEEQMRGVRRNAVFSPSHDVLYTLYTHQPGSGGGPGWPDADAAFVHTLNTDQHWAFCVDLEEPFGKGPNSGHAVAVSSDGRNLYVVDTTSGKLADIDTEALTVSRTVDLAGLSGPAYAATASDNLFVAADRKVSVIDRSTLRLRSTWELPAQAIGITSSMDRTRVYVATAGALDWYDVAKGVRLGGGPVAGLTGLRRTI